MNILHFIISFLLIIGTMFIVVKTELIAAVSSVSSSLVLGFMLLVSYCFGQFMNYLKMPKITGYILSGLFFGPYYLDLINQQTLTDLSFINSLALAFIAFCAGGELKASHVISNIKSILMLVISQSLVVFFGVSFLVYFLLDFVPVFSSANYITRIAVSMMFGIISVARSPSSTIAIISETKAKGRYTDIVLSVTIVIDVVIIVLFGIVISACQLLISNNGSINWSFFLALLFEIFVAIIFGFLLGKFTVFLIEYVKVEFPVVVISTGFIVIKFSHLLGDYLQETRNIAVNLEPLLICMVAGYVVQNYSAHGSIFLRKMESVSLVVYIAFFTMIGSSINIELLKNSWMIGLAIVFVRLVMLHAASYASGKLSRDEPRFYNRYWLGFITQAGVSLGLLTEIVRRFPEIGVPIQSILIAAITVNQFIGPIAFKYALQKVGDTNLQNGKLAPTASK
jgi:Kef-type K+ transport system membrane component KefB